MPIITNISWNLQIDLESTILITWGMTAIFNAFFIYILQMWFYVVPVTPLRTSLLLLPWKMTRPSNCGAAMYSKQIFTITFFHHHGLLQQLLTMPLPETDVKELGSHHYSLYAHGLHQFLLFTPLVITPCRSFACYMICVPKGLVQLVHQADQWHCSWHLGFGWIVYTCRSLVRHGHKTGHRNWAWREATAVTLHQQKDLHPCSCSGSLIQNVWTDNCCICQETEMVALIKWKTLWQVFLETWLEFL